jgi:hypothetical protein
VIDVRHHALLVGQVIEEAIAGSVIGEHKAVLPIEVLFDLCPCFSDALWVLVRKLLAVVADRMFAGLEGLLSPLVCLFELRP